MLHLPSTAWVLGGLEPIEPALSTRSVLLVPRMTADLPDDGLRTVAQLQMERAGRIEETIMAVDGTPGAEGFLVWWAQHVEQTLGSLDARQSGSRPEDRPGWRASWSWRRRASATAVLDDPGLQPQHVEPA